MAGTWAADSGIALDHRAEVPIGVQLDWSVRAAIAAGRLTPGQRIPALRDVAEELGVNHNTLRAAVAKLEADGLLERRHGSGTFVAAEAVAHERQAPLVEQVARWASDAGLSARDVASALYVRGTGPAAPAADAGADERRALRDDIAALERMLAELEAAVGELPPADPPPPGRSGPRVLTLDELRAQRRALVRRLAAAERALDDEDDAATASERAPRARRTPVARPRPSTT